MILEDLLLEEPVNRKGMEQFERREAKEVWFITHNFMRCPVCQKKTRMNYVRCDKCGADMGISRFLFEKLLKVMLNQ